MYVQHNRTIDQIIICYFILIVFNYSEYNKSKRSKYTLAKISAKLYIEIMFILLVTKHSKTSIYFQSDTITLQTTNTYSFSNELNLMLAQCRILKVWFDRLMNWLN